MLPILFAALLGVGNSDTLVATACVSRAGASPTEQRLDAVRRALQARVLKRGIRVVTCAPSVKADWHIVLEGKERNTVHLDVRGLHVARVENVDLTGLTELEAVQVMALTAAEAIRPAVDRLLLELGGAAEPDVDWAEPSPPPSRPLEPVTAINVVQEPQRLPEERPWMVGLLAGPVLDDQKQLFGWLELGVSVPTGWASVTGHAGIKETGDHLRHGLDVDRRTYELGLGAEHAFGALTLGAQLRLRILRAEAGNSLVQLDQTYAGAGVGATALWTLWHTRVVDFGLAFQGWFWPQPRRLTYDGRPFLTESFVEVFLGPTVRAHWP